jgi:hypothetical protein
VYYTTIPLNLNNCTIVAPKKIAREFSQRKINFFFLKIIVSFIFSPNRLSEQQGAENSGIVIFRMISRKP